MEEKKKRLQTIYDDFESAAASYKAEAACGKGCAFCCSDAGSIHITTLEGLAIRDRINRLPRPRQVAVNRKGVEGSRVQGLKGSREIER